MEKGSGWKRVWRLQCRSCSALCLLIRVRRGCVCVYSHVYVDVCEAVRVS